MIGVLHIDHDLCQGHGRCYALAPGLFAPDDLGTGMVSKADLESGDIVLARSAQAGCPEDAILID